MPDPTVTTYRRANLGVGARPGDFCSKRMRWTESVRGRRKPAVRPWAFTNTRNTPIEALERAFPIRVLVPAAQGSDGAGLVPGSEGIERDLLMLADVTVSLITERRVSQPWGLAGGGPGAGREAGCYLDGDGWRPSRGLSDKCTISASAGDVVRVLTPGGGRRSATPSSKTRGSLLVMSVAWLLTQVCHLCHLYRRP